ncbi:MAG TPA: VanZ family protein [Gemmatimonadaceae bacterium]|nr:VanZ family protein [Gemmatimonadaceae bacterium]
MKIARGIPHGRNGLAIVAVVIAILFATLFPAESSRPSAFSWTFALGRRGIGDAILNFFLFVPLGLAIAWKDRRAVTAAVCGVVLASLIELAQTVLPGRDPALSDIMLNGAGAFAGAFIARRRRTWAAPDARSSAILTASSLAVAAAIMTATGYLLSPRSGSATRATRQMALPESPSDGARDIRSLLTLNVRSSQEPVLVARSGNDLLLRYPSAGSAYGLDQPEYWESGFFDGAVSGRSGVVSMSRDRARWEISIDGARTTMGPTVGKGWAILAYPDAIGRRWGRSLSAAWLFAMCFPIGFWARGRGRIVAGAVIVMLLAFIPFGMGVLATPANEWSGGLVGFLLGAALREIVVVRSRRR